MSISWDNFACGKGVLYIGPNVLLCPLCTEAILEVKQEFQALLVSKAVKRACKTIHAC